MRNTKYIDEFISSGNVGNIDYRFLRGHVFISLEEMKAYEPWKENITKYVERWEKLGLLQGLEGEEIRERVALAYEELAILITCSVYGWSNDYFDSLLFAIIRRIVEKVGDKFSMKGFYYLMRENIDFIAKTFDDMQFNMDSCNGIIDIEAEFTVNICEIISELMLSEDDSTMEDFRKEVEKRTAKLELDIITRVKEKK